MKRRNLCIYIIDTSSLIELKNRYPRDIFPTLWDKIDELYKEGRLIAPIEVKKEIERGDDELSKWVKSRKKMFVNPNSTQVEKLKEILEKFPHLANPEKPGPHADPWLIALALSFKQNKNKLFKSETDEYIIITEESKKKKDRIPAIAERYNITSINLIELFKRENWRF